MVISVTGGFFIIACRCLTECVAVFTRRHVKLIAEYTVKGALALEAGVFVCLGDGLVGIAQQRANIFEPGIIDIAVKVCVERP